MEGTLAVRALQLNAYSAAIDALRASSNPNSPKTINLIKHLKDVFKISEVRHSAEVRRACGDERLANLTEGVFSASAWLRKCRRPVPTSDEPIGIRARKRKQLADELLHTVITAKSESRVPLVHLSINDEKNSIRSDNEPTEIKKEPLSTPTRLEPPKEHVIRLPRGTVIKVGEEKQEASKPGRKRKGDLVIKEVIPLEPPKRNRPIRPRIVPKRFHQSPDKQIVKLAIGYARTRDCVVRKLQKLEAKIQLTSASVKQENKVIKVENITELDQNKNKTVIKSVPPSVHPSPHPAGNSNLDIGKAVNGKSSSTSVITNKRKISTTEIPMMSNTPITSQSVLYSKQPAVLVTQPIQTVHIVQSSKTSPSFSPFGMADILNKEPAARHPLVPVTLSGTPTTPVPSKTDMSQAVSSSSTISKAEYSIPVASNTPNNTRSMKDSPRGSTSSSYEQQFVCKQQATTRQLQQQILQQTQPAPTHFIDVTPQRGVLRQQQEIDKRNRTCPSRKSYIIPSQQNTPHNKQSIQLRKGNTGVRPHQPVTSIGSHAQYRPANSMYVPIGQSLVPIDLNHSRQSIRPNYALVDNSILQNNIIQTTGLRQPLLLHPYPPASLITHGHPPTIGNGQLQLNGNTPTYSNIELARLQQPTNNNR